MMAPPRTPFRLVVWTTVLGALLWSWTGGSAASEARGAATPQRARGGDGAFLTDGAFVGYFVALNSTKAKEDDRTDDTFPSLNRNLTSGAFTGQEGSARATSKLTATVDDIDTGLRSISANGSVSGSSHRDGATPRPASPTRVPTRSSHSPSASTGPRP